MRILIAAVFALFASACAAGGYRPPVSSGVAPASAPTAPAAKQWHLNPPHSYESGQGRMVAVHTNPANGGAMFFESVARDGDSLSEFIASSCARIARGSESYLVCDVQHGDDGRSIQASFGIRGKPAMLIVHKVLGDQTKFMVCTGSWQVYPGTEASIAEQNGENVARLKSYCQQYAGY